MIWQKDDDASDRDDDYMIDTNIFSDATKYYIHLHGFPKSRLHCSTSIMSVSTHAMSHVRNEALNVLVYQLKRENLTEAGTTS